MTYYLSASMMQTSENANNNILFSNFLHIA